MLTRSLLAILVLAAFTVAARADDDPYGDPLPPGKTRLGTVRYRYGLNYSPTVTPDGKTILAHDNSYMHRFDIAGAPLKPPPGGDSMMIPTAFSADGTRAVSDQNSTVVWDVASGKAIVTLKRSAHYFDRGLALSALSADGKVLAVGGTKRAANEPADVLVWDVDGNREIARIVPPHNEQALVALSPDGKTLATWGKYAGPPGKTDYENNPGREVHFWDATNGKPLAKVRAYGYAPSAVAFSPDGALAAVAGSSAIDLVDPKTGASKQLLLGRVGIGRAVAFSPDGTTVFATSHAGLVQRWKTDGTRLSITEPPFANLHSGSVRPTAADRGVAWAQRSANMIVWEVPSGKLLGPQAGHFSHVSHLRVTPDSKHVITSAYDGQALKWELATGKLVGPTPGHPRPANTSNAPVEYTPAGAKGMIYESGGFAVHDGATGAQEYLIPAAASFSRAAFTPDGSKAILCEGTQDAKKGPALVSVWDVAAAKRLSLMPIPDSSAAIAALTPDGKHLVTVSRKPGEKNSNTFIVNAWTYPAGTKMSEHVEEGAYGTGGVALGDNETAAVVTSKGKLLRFDLATGKATPLQIGIDQVGTALAFSADGKSLAVYGPSLFKRPAPVAVLDWATAKVRQTFACPDGGAASAAFSPDGRYLITGTNQCTALVWELTK